MQFAKKTKKRRRNDKIHEIVFRVKCTYIKKKNQMKFRKKEKKFEMEERR